VEKHDFQPYFVVIGLMALTSLALAMTVDVNLTDQAGIRVELPDRVGGWIGAEVRYCQNPACQRVFYADQLTNMDRCPVCGGKLDSMSYTEKSLLPADTIILKKRYVSTNTMRAVVVSIVLSGKERASIHRPQICLVGQGREIVRSKVVTVPFAERKPLKVMVLDLLQHGRDPTSGKPVTTAGYYAYWFVGKGRETPYHLERMFWMGYDRVFHNRAHRWAYISVSGARDEKRGEAHYAEIRGFIGKLYPRIVRPDQS